MFLLWSSATSLVILVEGLSTRKCQRQGIQEVQICKGERAGMTCMDGCVLLDSSLVFFLVLSSVGGALSRASAYGYLSLGSIYLGVVLAEPSETKDHVLPTQTGDDKNGMLCMIPIADDQVNHKVDGICFVRCSVNVVD
ncbi:hypothetical protein C0989_008530 [Termitomyces sp. Mn162]|nr:hypothetical protein C0989_008530 [Termitomyces sp. Mn162]